MPEPWHSFFSSDDALMKEAKERRSHLNGKGVGASGVGSVLPTRDADGVVETSLLASRAGDKIGGAVCKTQVVDN